MAIGLTSSIFTRGSLFYLVTNANTDDEKVVAISRRPSKVAAQTNRHLMSFKADQCGDIPVTLLCERIT
ncbi:hypothetical protein [Shewanella surugensis]|uniref:Uncharacterized protein n=1 Tax=Shewanella surugensis TaxID=212020 RepID=A0ABT0LEV5_9GAMM|nr:hypothetical protein [Shewanella surugensis]MCL1126084.1 hypothetical protein [Shewanella surugensis]